MNMENGLNRTIIFLHIPKAAGTTIHSILENQYSSKSIFSIHGGKVQESMDKFKRLSDKRKREIILIKGHMKFGLHKFIPQPSTYFSLIRDPIDRIVSHYHYVLRTPNHYLYNKVKKADMDIKEYVESGISTELNNGQLRDLSGVGKSFKFGECPNNLMKIVRYNINTHFSFIGLFERFDESIIFLKRQFNWKTPYYIHRNVTKNRMKVKELDSETIKTIIKYNKMDIQFYNDYKEKFDKLIIQQPVSFFTELATFKIKNKHHVRYNHYNMLITEKIKMILSKLT